MNKKIAIIGSSGGLASALKNDLSTHSEVIAYGKDEYNLLNKNEVDILAKEISTKDVIICCTGVFKGIDSWDMYTINAVAPIYLIEQLTLLKSTAQFIMIGSHSSTWTSWPGATFIRTTYNNSKKTLQGMIESIEHSSSSSMKLAILNPKKFNSKMSNYSGINIKEIVSIIKYIIEHKNYITVYEI